MRGRQTQFEVRQVPLRHLELLGGRTGRRPVGLRFFPRRRGLRLRKAEIRQRALDGNLAIPVPVDGFEYGLDLQLSVLQYLQIGFDLRWELTRVLTAVLLEFLLLFDQPAAGILELRLQEFVGP